MESLRMMIENFPMDGEETLNTFEKRLAKENGWSLSYADKVVREYKRFVYLAMVSQGQVTPSEDVDQCWHLHLTCTVSYWERMHSFLPRRLHHHASKGGKAESNRMVEQYTATLELYRAEFGEAPPTDVWPHAEQRFGHDTQWVRVNTRDNWVFPKRRFRKGLILGSVLGGAAVLTGCTPLNLLADGLPVPFMVGGVVVVFLGVVVWAAKRVSQSGGGSAGDPVGTMHTGVYGGGHSHPTDPNRPAMVVDDTRPSETHDGFASGRDSHGSDASDSSVTPDQVSASDAGSDSGGGDSGGGDGGGCGGGGCGGGGGGD